MKNISKLLKWSTFIGLGIYALGALCIFNNMVIINYAFHIGLISYFLNEIVTYLNNK